MAGVERNLYQERKQSRATNALLWVGEKFNYVTIPLALVAIAGGAVALGLAALAIDVAELAAIRIYKKRQEGKQKTVFEANPPKSNVIFVDFKRRRSQQSQMAA